jgi:hypothetical protein
MNDSTPYLLRRGPTLPIYDRPLGVVHVPLFANPGFVLLDIEDYETLSKRKDLKLSPLNLGRHHGAPAVRARYRELDPDGSVVTQPMVDLLMRPGNSYRVAQVDGDPLNLRRSNLRMERVERVAEVVA